MNEDSTLMGIVPGGYQAQGSERTGNVFYELLEVTENIFDLQKQLLEFLHFKIIHGLINIFSTVMILKSLKLL